MVGASKERFVWPNTTQELTAFATPGVSRKAWGYREGGECTLRPEKVRGQGELRRLGEGWKERLLSLARMKHRSLQCDTSVLKVIF